jgi:hypothetical protein
VENEVVFPHSVLEERKGDSKGIPLKEVGISDALRESLLGLRNPRV